MTADSTIRIATRADATACAAIYAPYVAATPITFETVPPDAAEMACRIDAANQRHAWLVMVEQGRVVGYAYGSTFATRAAYGWAAEGSIYLHLDCHGAGRGRALYSELIERLRRRGYRRLVDIVTQPNEPSLGLHRAFDFAVVGTLYRVGWKNGSWHDVTYLELDLAPETGADHIPPAIS